MATGGGCEGNWVGFGGHSHRINGKCFPLGQDVVRYMPQAQGSIPGPWQLPCLQCPLQTLPFWLLSSFLFLQVYKGIIYKTGNSIFPHVQF